MVSCSVDMFMLWFIRDKPSWKARRKKRVPKDARKARPDMYMTDCLRLVSQGVDREAIPLQKPG